MNKKIIACDLDDVLWDLVPIWIEEYNRTFKPLQPIKKDDVITWDFSNVFPNKIDLQIFYNILTFHSFWDKVVANQDKNKIAENIQCIKQLSEKYDVYITTHTSYYQIYKLDLFLNMFKDCVNKDMLILIKDKWLIDADIVIDDRAETLQKFANKGTRCVKINQPWNKWFDCEGYDTFLQATKKLMLEV